MNHLKKWQTGLSLCLKRKMKADSLTKADVVVKTGLSRYKINSILEKKYDPTLDEFLLLSAGKKEEANKLIEERKKKEQENNS